ncbi:MAG: hypothetical protein SFW36_06305 [Leptolyngbyaceae cyanobacterium bins.59]|nr:hypothetical protein [Leptolyngbyaceae cyanobacterium bins.59]
MNRWFRHLLVCLAIVLLALVPLFLLFAALALSNLLNCEIPTPASAKPCPLWGNDISNTLAVMFLSPWYLFYTLPLGGLGLIVYILLAVMTDLLKTRNSSRRR